MSHQYQLRKRQRDEDDEQQPKHSRQKDIDEPVATPTKLTDVNNDCLEQIFLYLSVEDLLNIAHTNKQLKPAADVAFSWKFGGKKAQFIASGLSLSVCRLYLTVSYTEHKVRNPFRLLRCFGHLIPNHAHSKSKLLPYVNQYCRESITKIEFSGMSYNDFNALKMPFVNAKTVAFSSCQLDGKLNRLNILFPNIRSLWLECSESKPKHIEAHFPHLEDLEICGPIPTMQTKNTVNVLQLNPQLRRLTLDTDYTTKFIRAASQHLHLLEYLDISCSSKDFADFGDEIARFTCLKKLSISCEGKFNIPIESECLEELTLEFYYNDSEKVINFLEKHPSIIKLYLTGWWFELNEDIAMKIINALSLLEEVQLLGFWTSVNVAIRFMTNCKFLKKLDFEVVGYGEFEQIKKGLSEEWEPWYQYRTITVVKRET